MEKEAMKIPNIFKRYTGSKAGLPEEVLPIIKSTKNMAAEDGLKMFGEKEVQDHIRKVDIDQGNGLFTDALTGGTKMMANAVHRMKGGEGVSPLANKVDDSVAAIKGKLRDWDTAAGSFLGGDKQNMRARIFSTKENYKVGEQALEGGGKADINKEVRRASLTAPVTNTIKVTTPALATAYAAEKMFPTDENGQPTQTGQQAIAGRAVQEIQPKIEHTFGKSVRASENPSDGAEKHGIVKKEESIAEQLEKKAAFDKIAALELEIEKLGSDVEYYRQEAAMFQKTAMTERSAKDEFKKQAFTLGVELAEKEASHREFELRIAARERLKSVTPIVDAMLKTAQIKQVDYDRTIDYLMDCDDQVLNMHASLVKEASNDEDTLESLSFLQDDIVKDASVTTESEISPGYHDKKGQTIGEAAASLRKASK